MVKLIIITALIASNQGGAALTKTELEFKTLSACSTAAANFPAFENHVSHPDNNYIVARAYNHAYCIEEGK